MEQSREQAVAHLQSLGWSKEQSLGIAANLQQESGFRAGAVGDGGKAYGIAQWHPDRQQAFADRYGKSIRGSSMTEQLDFLNHELRAGNERAAGRRLLATTTAADAARITSIYYERPADREGEANRRAALASQLAGVPFIAPPAPTATPLPAGEVRPDPSWPQLPTARAARAAAAPIDTSILDSSLAITQRANASAGDSRAQSDALFAAAQAEQTRKDNTGFTDALAQARHDPRIQIMFNLLDKFNEDDEVVPAGWSYDTVRDKVEANRSDEEREYLRENATGPAALARAEGQLAYRRDLDRTYGDAGGLASFAGQMVGGMMDPVGLLAGVGVGKALQMAGVGSHALAAAGRVGAGRASFLAEGALGNVLAEGVQDSMGEVKTSADYAMAAAMGVAMTAPFAPLVRSHGDLDASIAQQTTSIAKAAANEQAQAVSDLVSTGMTPEAAGREVARREVDTILGETNAGTTKREQAVPEAVQADLRAELDGTAEVPTGMVETPVQAPARPVEATTAANGTQGTPELVGPPPEFAGPAPARTPEETAAYVQSTPDKGTEVALGVTKEGDTVQLEWTHSQLAQDPSAQSMRTLLDSVVASDAVAADLKAVARYILGSGAKDTLDGIKVSTFMKRGKNQGFFQASSRRLAVGTDFGAQERRSLGIKGIIDSSPDVVQRTAVHEAMHAVTSVKVQAYLDGQGVGAAATAAKQLDEVFAAYKAATKGNPDWQVTYAAKNLHEFIAQLWTEPAVQEVLAAMPSTASGRTTGTMWGKVLKAISDILFGGKLQSKTALADAMRYTDSLIRASDAQYVDAQGAPVLYSQLPPSALVAARQRRLERIVRHAQVFMQANPISQARLQTLTRLAARFGGMSDGLVLASSRNPVVQMIASLVTETTTGAAGRKATVSIRTEMLKNKLTGNGIMDYQNARAQWHAARGTSARDKFITGAADREFGREVMIEMRRRAQAGYTPTTDANVRAAADSFERGFQRAADEQRAAGTLGADRLELSSRGYVPQALDGHKLAELANDAGRYNDLRQALAAQFAGQLGWDRRFASLFAQHYMERVRRRAMGDKSMDGMAAAGDGMAVVRDTLEELGRDPNLRDRAAAAGAALGQGHTKKRLNIDLLAPFENGMLLDFYVTNPVQLYRRYMHGTAGNIALTESGILGTQGARELRSAASTPAPGAPAATIEELNAIDRVFSEVLGTPVAGEVVSAGATNLGMIVGVQRLGGLVWTQAQESWNLLHHVGLRSTLAGIASLPRMIGEVRASAGGRPVANSILGSIETYGGEIGMSGHKMVMPLDAPDMHVSQYMEQPSVLSRLLRAGGHVQAVATGFRVLMASQHRMAAEQVTMKALRMVRDAKDSAALADMGITPQLAAGLRAELPHAARWDSSGRLVSFDITQITDPYISEGFAQAVHRGTSQIIQGTFIGERSKWFHNDYVRLLMQLRSFGMTAMEKQWSRTRMNQGFGTAAAMLVVQMSLALPMHLARVQIAAAGREDRKKYLEDNTSPAALLRAVMNYSSLSGLTGDMMEAVSGVVGGWGDDRTKEVLGARQTSGSIGRAIPALGTLDAFLRVGTGKADLYTAVKQLPFSSVWYLVPILNLLKEK